MPKRHSLNNSTETFGISNETSNDLPIVHSKDAPKKRNNIISWIIGSVVLVAVYSHFIWATVYFVLYSDDILDATTCTGYGFWMILMIIITFGIIYKFLISRYIVPPIQKFIWKPCNEQFNKIPHSTIIFLGLILVAIFVFLIIDTHDDRQRLMPLSGLAIFILIGYLFSPYKRKIPWRTLLSGLITQFILGLFMIRWKVGRNIFSCVGDKVNSFLHYAVNASAFVYSDQLVLSDTPVFAFSALAAIYLMSFFINLLYYYGIVQHIILSLGGLFQWLLGTTICESVNSAANIFFGMSESPFLLKPYLDHMTNSEIHSIMTSGFASVSGTVLAAYVQFGADPGHLVTSCVMSAPAALCYSKLMYPETEQVLVKKDEIKTITMKFDSPLDAAVKGINDAVSIVLGIIGSLIAFIAVVYFIDGVLEFLGTLVGYMRDGEIWSLELILGKVLTPLAYTMGVEWDDCEDVGRLIGIKTVLNEFVAFQTMQNMTLTTKSKVIATYSICGFSNPGSMGTMLATLGAFMPNKKENLSRLVFRAFIGGAFTCLMTACVAGLLTT